MRLFELNELQPFKTDEYNTPNQMEIMANPDYWREKKGVVGSVQWMTPTQYIQACEIGFRNNGSEGLVRGGRTPELIKKYAFDMKRGDKFPMLELDYRDDYFGQEGLHRAMAAEDIGVKKLPVFIMKSVPREMDEAVKLTKDEDNVTDKFMDTLRKVTQDHPFDPGQRIAWDGKSTIDIKPMWGDIHVSAIQTLAPEERSGSANGLMMTVTKIADETGAKVRLEAKPFGTTEGKLTKRQLMAWYKRLGFVPDPDYGGGANMIYTPPVEECMFEEAPPGMEGWIKKRKPEFKKRYGDRWEEVLYATAWKQHNAS